MLMMLLANFGTTAEDPDRFPVTRFDLPDEKPAGIPSAVVLDDCDPEYDKKLPHRDGLRILQVADFAVSGHVKSIIKTEFNTCQTIGGSHTLAVDAKRGRIYLSELAGDRVTALDFRGRKIWQVTNINAGALAVDPKTGRLWCSVGSKIGQGETVVLDPDGLEVASLPVLGTDMAYDPHTDAFWLVGAEITKVSREGKVLFQEPCAGWAFVSVAVNSIDGSVWIVEHARIRSCRAVSTDFGTATPTAASSRSADWASNRSSASLASRKRGRRGSRVFSPTSCASRPKAATCGRFLSRHVLSPSARRPDESGYRPKLKLSGSTKRNGHIWPIVFQT